jgi:putative ABC transport system permease protein
MRYRLGALFARHRFETDMKEEFAFHLSLEAQQQGAPGSGDAQFAARRRLGNQPRLEEERREEAGIGFLDVLAQDLRFALRSFARTPGFTAVAILALAIGIGANTAIFSAVNALLLRPLPFAEPELLMKVSQTEPARDGSPGNDDGTWSVPMFGSLRRQQTVFEDLSIYTNIDMTVRIDGDATREPGEIIDDHYLTTLRVSPILGRNFLPEEVALNGPKVVILSNGYWQRRFNADPAVLGKTLNISGEGFTVVGVMPPGFRGMSGAAEIWTPIVAFWGESITEAHSHAFSGIARRKPGVPVEQAQAVVHDLGARVFREFVDGSGNDLAWGALARPLNSTRVDPLIRRSLLVLLGAVALVLLIACVNVANLLLIRSAGRRREIAVRLAIGASRTRLIRQLLTESMLLSLAGGTAGLAIAWWGVRVLSRLDPTSALGGVPLSGIGAVSFTGIALDRTALLFTVVIALGTGILFGLIPALQSTRPSLVPSLSAAGPVGRLRRISSRSVLAVAEIALALLLLTGAGLALRSLGKLLGVDSGFRPERVLSIRLNSDLARDSLPVLFDQITERLGALPGVQNVSMTDCLPLSGGCNGTVMWQRDRAPVPQGTEPEVGVHWASPEWASTLQVPLITGRLFEPSDRKGSPKVVLISEAAARRYWPGQDPIGRGVSVGQGGFHADTAFVIGVVGDVRYVGIDQVPRPDVYLPFAQSPRGRMVILLRTQGDPAALAAPARQALRELVPGAPVYDIRTLESRVSDAMAFPRFSATLLGLFALVALALATMGIYGVISFGVAQRTQELGIRSALGASRWDVVKLVARHGAAIAAVGGAVGLGSALLLTRLLEALLYDVPSNDPLTFAVVTLVMLTAVTAACLVPARRAAAIPPADALRRG